MKNLFTKIDTIGGSRNGILHVSLGEISYRISYRDDAL